MDGEQAARRPGYILVDPSRRWVFRDRQALEAAVSGWALLDFLDRDLMGAYEHLSLSVEVRRALATNDAALDEARRSHGYSFVDYGLKGLMPNEVAAMVLATVRGLLDRGVEMERGVARGQ